MAEGGIRGSLHAAARFRPPVTGRSAVARRSRPLSPAVDRRHDDGGSFQDGSPSPRPTRSPPSADAVLAGADFTALMPFERVPSQSLNATCLVVPSVKVLNYSGIEGTCHERRERPGSFLQ